MAVGRDTMRLSHRPALAGSITRASHVRLPALSAAALALALVASTAGAQQAASAAVPQPASADRSRPLEGRWSVELLLDPRSMQNPPPAEKITGEVAFGSGSWWTNTDRFGRHSIDTRPFFGRSYAAPQNVQAFGAADTSLFTEVSGGLMGDSVAVDFLPRLDHGGLSLWGRFYGDSARGRWHRRGAEGSGFFVMRRVSRDAVAIAAIPVPSVSAPPVAVASTTPDAKPSKGRTKGKKPTKAELKAEQKVAAAAAKAAAANASPTPTTVASATTATPPSKVGAQPSPSATTSTLSAATAAAPTPKAPVATVASAPSTTSAKTPAPSLTTASTTSALTTGAPTTNAPATGATTTSATTIPSPSVAAKASPSTSVAAKPSPSTSVAANQPSIAAVTAPPPAPVRAPPPSRTAPIDPAATGSIRVRMFDSASKKYFVTRYQLHLPDGTFKWGNFRSGGGDDGFGPVVPSRPGRYEVEVENFVCGDKFWFFADKVVRPVVVQAGDTTDVSIELDLSKAPAKKTIDNKAGALCTAGPGTPK